MTKHAKPIYLDASTLLGSGQTVRLAIGFSALLQRPIVLHRIRERRDNPGLKEHHVVAAKTIARMMSARIEGASIGSRELYVHTSQIEGGTYRIRIDGQGSAVNVLESAMLPAFFAKRKTTLIITGGTFFPWIHFNTCVIPLLRRMGIHLLPFYDGTQIGVTIFPGTRLRPLVLKKRGTYRNRFTIAFGKHLRNSPNYTLKNKIDYFWGSGEKTSLTTIFDFSNVALGFDGILGKRKEETSEEEIAQRAHAELRTGATVDTKTAEQLLPWAALSKNSLIRVAHLTEHLKTALWLVEELLKKQITVHEHADCVSLSSKVS